MNKWFRRAVGTVGIAGGILLLGAGNANADDAALTPGLLDDLFSPTGGPNNRALALAPDAPASTTEKLVLHSFDVLAENSAAPGSFQMREVLSALPIDSVLPTDGLGLPSARSIAPLSQDQDMVTLGTPGAQLIDALGAPGIGSSARGSAAAGS